MGPQVYYFLKNQALILCKFLWAFEKITRKICWDLGSVSFTGSHGRNFELKYKASRDFHSNEYFLTY